MAEGQDKESAIAICYSTIVGKAMSDTSEPTEKARTLKPAPRDSGIPVAPTLTPDSKAEKCGDYAYSPAGGATSLEDLAAMRAAQEQTYALQSVLYDFQDVTYNIASSPDIPDKGAAIAQEAGVLQSMLAALSEGLKGFRDFVAKAGARHSKTDNEAIQSVHDMAVQLGAMCEGKAKSAFGVAKGRDGQWYGLGIFTNPYRDDEGDFIESKAHEEFAAYLDANPEYAPELWSWHEEGTARKSRANWWDYDGTFFWMQWPLTQDEAKALQDITPCTMSHQFNGVKAGDTWTFYRSFEASVTPTGAEINSYTSFDAIAKEMLAMKGFSPEKRAFLVALHGEDFVQQREQLSEKAHKALDQAHTERKSKDGSEATPTPDTATTTPVVPVGEVAPTVDQAIITLTDSLTKLTADVAALTGEVKALKATKQKEISTEAERLTAQTMQRLTSPRGPTVGIAEAAKAQGEALTPEQMKAAGVVDAVTVAAGWENAQIRRG